MKRPSLSRWLLLAAPPGAASAVMLAAGVRVDSGSGPGPIGASANAEAMP